MVRRENVNERGTQLCTRTNSLSAGKLTRSLTHYFGQKPEINASGDVYYAILAYIFTNKKQSVISAALAAMNKKEG